MAGIEHFYIFIDGNGENEGRLALNPETRILEREFGFLIVRGINRAFVKTSCLLQRGVWISCHYRCR